MKKMQKGFTLIELMIVVAIIAILAAIAIPAYQDYLIRSQVSEGAVLSDGAKTALAEFYSNKGVFPTTNASAGLALPGSIVGKYVTKVDAGATQGQIQATFGGAANSKIATKLLVFSAITHAGSISWTCSNAATTVDQKYLPTSCRTGN
ncbi:MAG: pilin [Pseudomonadota bacterium]|jgi:type IV pilus assembly protein PilA